MHHTLKFRCSVELQTNTKREHACKSMLEHIKIAPCKTKGRTAEKEEEEKETINLIFSRAKGCITPTPNT